MNKIELTDNELAVLKAMITYVSELPISFEGVEGYLDDDIDVWETINELEAKL